MQYAELHCKTNFSFLEGASRADELIDRAAYYRYSALAVTDINSVAGVVRAFGAAKDLHFKLIIGAEVTPVDAPPVVLWATDRSSYGRLSRLLTVGRRRAAKGQCEIHLDDIAQLNDGLLAGVLPTVSASTPACPTDPAYSKQLASCEAYRDIFVDRAYMLAYLCRGSDDAGRLAAFQQLSQQTDLPLVASGNVLYHSRSRKPLQDVLTATKHNTTVADAGEMLTANAERHLKRIEELQRIFAATPEAIARTVEIADRCSFCLSELRFEYPIELSGDQATPIQYLRQLTWQGAAERYPAGVPTKVRELVGHELNLIEDLKYEAYFLTVWDLVRFARSKDILCQGRGSAANSAVCYCLGVTSVDPDQADVLFERFVSKERDEAPDIDVDFEHERREEVLQYLYEKYGRERTGLAATVITYRSRSAIRDVGKALGLSLDRVDALAKNIDGHSRGDADMAERCEEVGIDPQSEYGKRLVHLIDELIGFPRHLSQHVGGMVITQGPLCELVPIENAAMEDRTVIQWDKSDLDELGILKVDCLSLGMLTAIRKCFDLVSGFQPAALPANGVQKSLPQYGSRWTLATVPKEDPHVYDMICAADTMGVFQIESRAQMSMLPRLRPRCFYDLVIEVAIVRPGPIQGQMVHPYLRRRAGEEQPTYPSEEIREVLYKTLGVPLFQEQAMRLAVVAAGFTPGEADQLRRAMGAWRRPGVIDQFHKKLIKGMLDRGLDMQFAENVFRQIRGFGEYGFPESHAASFAKLVYVSAWLKCHFPAAFCAAIINSLPMGFYAPAQLVRDARDHDVEILPVDVNASSWDCTLEATAVTQGQPAVRLGFRLIRGLSSSVGQAIALARESEPFTSQREFVRRTGLSSAVVSKLSAADAFNSLGRSRRESLWDALEQERCKQEQPLFDTLGEQEDDVVLGLPDLADEEQVYADYQTIGLSLRDHPLAFHRQLLDDLEVLKAEQLEGIANNALVKVAGLVLLRQRPSTAKGITFVTLEDETGIANLVLHQTVWLKYRKITRHAPVWIAHGRLECKDSVIHVVVNHLEDMSARLDDLKMQSRDFR